MKKSLVLALVLVMALTASAFAGVTVGGEFEAKLSQEAAELKFGEGKFGLSNSLKLTVGATGEDEGWSFSGELGDLRHDKEVKLGKYELKLTDDLFAASIWGNEKETSDKASLLEFVKAPKKADKGKMRLRVTAPVLDYANVTFDYAPEKEAYAFVEGEVAGYNVGLALRQQFAVAGVKAEDAAPADIQDRWDADGNLVKYTVTPEKKEKADVAAISTVVGFGTIELDVATIKLEAGARLGDDIPSEKNFAFGADVSAPVAEGVTVNAGYQEKGINFATNGARKITAGVKYDGIVTADASYTNEGSKAQFNTSTIKGSVAYVPFEEAEIKLSASMIEQKKDEKTATTGKGLARVNVDNTTYKIGVDASAPVIEGITANLGASYTSNEEGVAELKNYEHRASRSVSGGELIGYTEGGDPIYAPVVPARVKEGVRIAAKKAYELTASVDVAATEKLTLTPSVSYLNFEGGKGAGFARRPDSTERIAWATEGSIFTIKNVAEYTLGAGSTVLSFELGQTTNDIEKWDNESGALGTLDEKEQFATFKVTVKF